MSPDPRVSVLMPVRNGAPWLAAACRSVISQTLTDFELVIVDDGSTDETPEIARSIAESDTRVRVERQQPLGLVAALNRGLELSRAPLVARLDADDLAMPRRLERQVALMASNERLVLLGTWATKIDAAGAVRGRLAPQFAGEAVAVCLVERNPFVHSSVMMRRAAALAVGAYRAPCQGAEDYDLWLRLAEVGEIDILPEELVAYRVHDASVSRTSVVRQCFAARLAILAANERRARRPDPVAACSQPPDWWDEAVCTGVLEPMSRLCRLLDFAAPDAADRHPIDRLRQPDWDAIGPMIHVEKVLLRRAVFNLLKARDRASGLGFRQLARAVYASLFA